MADKLRRKKPVTQDDMVRAIKLKRELNYPGFVKKVKELDERPYRDIALDPATKAAYSQYKLTGKIPKQTKHRKTDTNVSAHTVSEPEFDSKKFKMVNGFMVPNYNRGNPTYAITRADPLISSQAAHEVITRDLTYLNYNKLLSENLPDFTNPATFNPDKQYQNTKLYEVALQAMKKVMERRTMFEFTKANIRLLKTICDRIMSDSQSTQLLMYANASPMIPLYMYINGYPDRFNKKIIVSDKSDYLQRVIKSPNTQNFKFADNSKFLVDLYTDQNCFVLDFTMTPNLVYARFRDFQRKLKLNSISINGSVVGATGMEDRVFYIISPFALGNDQMSFYKNMGYHTFTNNYSDFALKAKVIERVKDIDGMKELYDILTHQNVGVSRSDKSMVGINGVSTPLQVKPRDKEILVSNTFSSNELADQQQPDTTQQQPDTTQQPGTVYNALTSIPRSIFNLLPGYGRNTHQVVPRQAIPSVHDEADKPIESITQEAKPIKLEDLQDDQHTWFRPTSTVRSGNPDQDTIPDNVTVHSLDLHHLNDEDYKYTFGEDRQKYSAAQGIKLISFQTNRYKSVSLKDLLDDDLSKEGILMIYNTTYNNLDSNVEKNLKEDFHGKAVFARVLNVSLDRPEKINEKKPYKYKPASYFITININGDRHTIKRKGSIDILNDNKFQEKTSDITNEEEAEINNYYTCSPNQQSFGFPGADNSKISEVLLSYLLKYCTKLRVSHDGLEPGDRDNIEDFEQGERRDIFSRMIYDPPRVGGKIQAKMIKSGGALQEYSDYEAIFGFKSYELLSSQGILKNINSYVYRILL